MKILVCISCVPDTTSKITIDPSTSQISSQGLTFIVGPYDDYALSRAIELKESNGAEVIVLHVGGVESEALIRKCLALGADSAVRIDGNPTTSAQIAHSIVSYVNQNPMDLILMGKESIDYNSGIVHGLVAGALGYTHFNPVMHLDFSGDGLKLEVEMDGGKMDVSCPLPAVLGCQEPIAEWKIPSMRGIMTARTKEIAVLPFDTSSQIQILKADIAETARKNKMINAEDAEQLIDLLRTETNVL
ncbi:electron transfer flavoprotein subunit beta/FixA family protein [Aquirufa lenticrescens]|uniref:electron transfer flavoprotein subunit beta/FixA family protein n=1 Tax=Aquirufa lenticrescens TaxID=2696560 RepID=UPI001CAA63AC|nr:electron transfer flavoprotein subunit beta/FixA family protein [Aquirufa lenticrescens]UAJ14971.1 electron transfer flavoprotein subunit beta/FixA family protein [Aquirufa lenticrescens]